MEKVYTQVSHKTAVENIKAMFAASTQTQIDAGMAWYQNAQDQAQAIAIKHNMPVYIVVAVIAALGNIAHCKKHIMMRRVILI